jgi:hypothetical protein
LIQKADEDVGPEAAEFATRLLEVGNASETATRKFVHLDAERVEFVDIRVARQQRDHRDSVAPVDAVVRRANAPPWFRRSAPQSAP